MSQEEFGILLTGWSCRPGIKVLSNVWFCVVAQQRDPLTKLQQLHLKGWKEQNLWPEPNLKLLSAAVTTNNDTRLQTESDDRDPPPEKLLIHLLICLWLGVWIHYIRKQTCAVCPRAVGFCWLHSQKHWNIQRSKKEKCNKVGQNHKLLDNKEAVGSSLH